MSYFFLGQGKLYAAKRSVSGGVLTVGGYSFLGNCSMLDAVIGAGISQYAKGGTEARAAADRVSEPPSFNLTMEDFSSANLAMITYGQNTAIAGATITSEAVVAAAGLMVPLANINLASFTSLKNAADTVTYVPGTDYSVNLKAGSITILSGSAIADGQNLHANYITNASTKISVGTMAPAYYQLRLEGVNVAVGNDPVVVDIYKARFWPVDKLPLLGDKHVAFSLTGRIFYDTLQADTTGDGRIMRVRKV